MRKLIISAALLSAFAVSAPATAQRWDDRNQGYGQNQSRGFEQQLHQLRQRIDNMYQRRLLSNNEARKLQGRVNDLRNRLYDYSRGGLSYRERDDLQRRIHDLRERLRDERHEGREQRRDDRRDRW
jgi:septal ring factor EnvC (AmiA/AmiB activator)